MVASDGIERAEILLSDRIHEFRGMACARGAERRQCQQLRSGGAHRVVL